MALIDGSSLIDGEEEEEEEEVNSPLSRKEVLLWPASQVVRAPRIHKG